MPRARDRDPTASENKHRAKRMDDEVVFPVKAAWSASVLGQARLVGLWQNLGNCAKLPRD
jgi:hypothetical protein